MNAQTLAEIGSWVAGNADGTIYTGQPQQAFAAQAYWTASKCRLQRWAGALKMFERDLEMNDPNHDPWPAFEIVVQEIFLSEMLTRIFAGVLVTHDHFNDGDELSGMAHGIQIGHIEAKNRALRIMLRGQAANEDAFNAMNMLRRRIERWTDLFMAQLPVCEKADSFAFDIGRLNDFRLENRQASPKDKQRRSVVFAASFASDMRTISIQFPANPELNRQIASGVIAFLPADRFDSNGLPKSVNMVWVEKSQSDTQMLVDCLMKVDDDYSRQA